MQKSAKLLIVAMVAAIATIGSGYAFADNNTDAASQGLNAGIALKISGMSVLPGLALSLFTVLNKNITGTGSSKNGQEAIQAGKLVTNVILGVIVSVVLSIIGISTDSIHANSTFLVGVISMSVNYMFLHWSNLIIRPIFAHLINFKGAFQKWLAEKNGTSNGSNGPAGKPPGQQ